MKMTFNLNTVVITVGPSNCGKSYLTGLLVEKLKTDYPELNIQCLSSDEERRNLLGQPDANKYDNRMFEVSEGAFNVLFRKLDALTSYPTNADLIFVDTTGLNKVFRDKVKAVCDKNQYNFSAIIFDYKERDHFFINHGNKDERIHSKTAEVINKHINKLRRTALREMTVDQFQNRYFIHSILQLPAFVNDACINVPEKWATNRAEPNTSYFVIGDVHGCLSELKNLVRHAGFELDEHDNITGHKDVEYQNKKIVLAGDWVDKGPDSIGVVKWIETNKHLVRTIIGNHERFVEGILRNRKGYALTDDVKPYFTSIKEFTEAGQDVIDMFLRVFDESSDFIQGDGFYITHVPMPMNMIGKYQTNCIRRNNRYRYPHREDYSSFTEYQQALFDDLKWFRDEANYSFPMFVFGHIPFESATGKGFLNRVPLDTGCVEGNKLSGVYLYPGFKNIKILTVDSLQPKPSEDYQFPVYMYTDGMDGTQLLENIDPEDLRRIKSIVRNQTQYIANTMAPSAASLGATYELEPFSTALQYYKEQGAERVVIQPKFMGSRVQLVLNEKGEYKLNSRRGFQVKTCPELEDQMRELYDKFFNSDEFIDSCIELGVFGDKTVTKEECFLEEIILDGELMPWSYLAEGLIDKTFNVYSSSLEADINFRESTGFEDALKKQLENLSDSIASLKQDRTDGVKKKELTEKYGQNLYSQLDNLIAANSQFISSESVKPGLDTFNKQLDWFGRSDVTPKIELFGILKMKFSIGKQTHNWYYADGTINNAIMFNMVNKDWLARCFDLTDDYLDRFALITDELWARCREFQLEGYVVKPFIPNPEKMVGAIKVRSEDYLHIVYGADYKTQDKYARLCEGKRIFRKLSLSRQGEVNALKLLACDSGELNLGNYDYTNGLKTMLRVVADESTLDPRL